MSSTVCQGLQSCLEPRLLEQRALCLRLVSPEATQLFKRPESQTHAAKKCSSNDNTDQKDLETFSSIKSPTTNTPQESAYTHPLLSQSSSSLSKKSLELCTENLGCETGTDITENSCFLSPASSGSEMKSPFERRRVVKKEKCGAFPPPLTTIAGEACIHVRPHREDGRLVLTAITAPSPRSCFQAERSEGRLRLRFNSQYSNMEAAKEENEDEDIVYLGRGSRNVSESNGGGEIGIGKIQRPSRCSEGRGHGKKGLILIWETFWVASS